MHSLIYTIAPVVAALIGGGLTACYPPSRRLQSLVQHLAAGVVFAAAAVELLPEVVRANAPWPTLLGSAIGVATMALLQAGERRFAGAIGLVTTTVVDVLIDGFVLGLSFLQGAKQGLLLTIALTLELLFLGLSVAGSLARSSKLRIMGVTAIVVLALPLGTVVGLQLGALSRDTLSGFYAFGLIALLYLVTEELLKEAHKTEDTTMMPVAFFAGFIAMLFLSELL